MKNIVLYLNILFLMNLFKKRLNIYIIYQIIVYINILIKNKIYIQIYCLFCSSGIQKTKLVSAVAIIKYLGLKHRHSQFLV